MAIQTFTSGQVLTAAQVNALQSNDFNQTVTTKTANATLVASDKGTRVVMNVSTASTITVDTSIFSAGDTIILQNIASNASTVTAGTATVSSAGSLAIPQFGSGTLFFTSASAAIFFPSAGTSSPSAVVQVKSTTLTSTFTGTATKGSFLAVTGLTVSITPTSASNKVLVQCSLNTGKFSGGQGNAAILTGGNCANGVGDAAGNRMRAYSAAPQGDSFGENLNLMFLDSPATTSATIYGVSIAYMADGTGTGSVFVNKTNNDADANTDARMSSTITVMEVTP